MIGLVDGDEEATLLGDKEADEALLGNNDGVTDGSRMLGLAEGDAKATLLGDDDAEGTLLGNTD